MNEYLERKRRERKPISHAPIRTHHREKRDALQHDAPEETKYRGRDGLAYLLWSGRRLRGQTPEEAPGAKRQHALATMRARGKWQKGNPSREDYWQTDKWDDA